MSGKSNSSAASQETPSGIFTAFIDEVSFLKAAAPGNTLEETGTRVSKMSSSASHTSDESSEDASADGSAGNPATAGKVPRRSVARSSISEGVSRVKRSVTTGSRKSVQMHSSGTLDTSGQMFLGADRDLDSEGPILDISMMVKGQKCPQGYNKVMAVGKGHPADLNKGQAGKSLFLCYKRGWGTPSKPPITGIAIFHEGKEEFVPAGFEIVGTSFSGQFLADLSMGGGVFGRIFLCVCRGDGPPLADLCVVNWQNRDLLPEDYGVVERTPLGYSALLNGKGKSASCYLSFRKDTSRLNLLKGFDGNSINLGAKLSLSPVFGRTDLQRRSGNSSDERDEGHKWCTFLTKKDLLDSGIGPETIVALYKLLKVCYAGEIPHMILALHGLNKILQVSSLKHHLHGSSNLGARDVIVKAAVDCTELGADVLFAPAMQVIITAVTQNPGGLPPCTMHFIAKAIVRVDCFFKMHPMKAYTGASHHRRTDSHRFYSTSTYDSLSSTEEQQCLESGSGLADSGEMSANQLVDSVSMISLADLNFLLRSSNAIFDLIVEHVPTFLVNQDGNSTISSQRMEVIDQFACQLAKYRWESVAFAQTIHNMCERLGLENLAQKNAVMMLVWLSQAGAMTLRSPLRKGRLFNAEFNQKNAVMQLLKEFLASIGGSGKDFFQAQAFSHQIRAFTFRAVISNASDMKRVHLILPILSELWKSSRQHLKIEFAIVLDNLMLTVLRDKLTPPHIRRDFLNTMISLFGMHPSDLVELFLNFENDPVVANWKTFNHLIEVLCQLTDESVYLLETDSHQLSINKEMQYDSLASLVTLLRSLTDMSGSLRLKDVDGIQEKVQERDEAASVRSRHEARTKTIKALVSSFEASSTEMDAGKAVKMLIQKGELAQEPDAIATFLHLYHRELGERGVGKYLGSKPREAFMSEVRRKFVRALPFAGKSFEQCLRLYLEKGHLFLPGESEQVECLMTAFAEWFVVQNREEFREEDTDMIMLLAFTTIMLNTDLHNPNVRAKKRMTPEQFVKQISYIENGERISQEFALSLYQSIARKEIRPASEKTLEESGLDTFKEKVVHSEQETLSSANATANNNNNNRREIRSEDSSETKRDAGHQGPNEATLRARTAGDSILTRQKANLVFQKKLGIAVADMEISMGVMLGTWKPYHTSITLDSVRVMFEIVWVHFFSVVTKILEDPKMFALDAVSLALDVLNHCICTSLFLGMEEERKGFAMLLAKVHYLYTNNSDQNSLGVLQGEHLNNNKWYEDVMSASCDSENLIEVINDVHQLTASMKAKIEDRRRHEGLLQIQKKFDSGAAIIEAGRKFVRDASLLKKSRNKWKKYHFFLFSDVLIYASRSMTSNKYSIHQMLKLHTMQVRECKYAKSFEIRHPKKSFIVQAHSETDKENWVRDIRNEVDTLFREQLGTSGPTSTPFHPAAVLPKVRASSVTADDRKPQVIVKSRSSSVAAPHSNANGESALVGMEDDDDDDDDSIQDPQAFACDEDDEDDEINDEEDESKLMSKSIATTDSADAFDLMNDDDSAGSTKIHGAFGGQVGTLTVSADGFEIINEEENGSSRSLGPHDTLGREKIFRTMNQNDAGVFNSALTRIDSMSVLEEESIEAKVEWLNELPKRVGGADPTIRGLEPNDLHQKFVVGLRFAKPILTSTHTQYVASDEQKLLIYGFFKQSTQGDCAIEEPSPDDWVSFSKFKVWMSLQGMDQNESKQKFLTVLSQVAPGWGDRATTTA